jgi:hypothetical protein
MEITPEEYNRVVAGLGTQLELFERYSAELFRDLEAEKKVAVHLRQQLYLTSEANNVMEVKLLLITSKLQAVQSWAANKRPTREWPIAVLALVQECLDIEAGKINPGK